MIRIFLRAVLFFAILCPAATSFSAERPRDTRRTVPIHYEQRDISQLVSTIARATGRRYIFDDTLRGRVTITVPGRVSEDEAIALLNAALLIKGFAALPIGDDTTKIVPLAETASGAPLVVGPLDPEAERPITTMIRLRHADASQAVTALGPHVAASGAALPYPPSNSVILAGTEARVARLMTILRILDQTENESILVRTLRHRSASTVAEILEVTFNEGRRSTARVGIWVDERTNQIIAQATPVRLEAIRATIDEIDRLDEGEGLIRVVRILNRNVEEIAEILQSMQQESDQRRPGDPAGLAGQIGESLANRPYTVAVDQATRSILLSSDPETLALLVSVIDQLDRLPPRVAVDVMILELVRPSGYKLGIDYFLPVLEPSSATAPAVFLSSGGASISPTSELFSTGVPSGPSSGDFVFGRYTRSPLQLSLDSDSGDPITINVPRENISFAAGASRAETNILMRPHILAMSGEEHKIFVGSEIPVPVGSSSGNNEEIGPLGALGNQQTIERKDVGVELIVKPTVGQEGVVILDLKVEISEMQSSLAGPVDQVGPTFAQRTIESSLRLAEGEFAVLGTSNGSAEAVSEVGVPFLKDIPFLGAFFRTDSRTRIDNDLLIVVEAHILRSPSEDVAYTIRRRIAMERAMSRVADLESLDSNPFAVLLDTVNHEAGALRLSEAFDEDGFKTEITAWESTSGMLWDVYLTGFESFEMAGGVARRLSEAGWSPEVTVLSPENELAGD